MTITCPACGARIEPEHSTVLSHLDLTLHVQLNRLDIAGYGSMSLSSNLTLILAELIKHHDDVCSKDYLLDATDQWEIDPKIMAVQIYNLRRLFNHARARTWIEGIRGKGYILCARKPRDGTPWYLLPPIHRPGGDLPARRTPEGAVIHA